MNTFTRDNFLTICRQLAQKHKSIQTITETYGFPPVYERAFGFETLVQIILEQQVSLASAKAVYGRLQQALGKITPYNLLQLNTQDLRNLSVSRQKAGYLHHLSHMVEHKLLNLKDLPDKTDDEVRQTLIQVKGIGPWTADVVLMLCLKRNDVFPTGDVALVNSVRYIYEKPDWGIEEIKEYATTYKPYRTMATYCYWHAYIQRKNIIAPS
jgi:DNA-3-methyladenine glycosylase II